MATTLYSTNSISNISSGFGELDFEKITGRTIVRKSIAKAPLRFLMPRNHGEAAWVYTSNYGGGFVGGDHVNIRLHVRPDAEAVLLTQSTTKVYRSQKGSSQSIEAHVEQNGSLMMIPDPISCFAGSSFLQKQNLNLEEGASLLLIDTVNCGRNASGERWLFDRFHSQIHVSRKTVPIFFESLLLDSNPGDIAIRNGRFNIFSMVLMIGPDFIGHGMEILKSLSGSSPKARADLIIVASSLSREGILLRIAAVSTEKLENALHSYLYFLPDKLGDSPWERKR